MPRPGAVVLPSWVITRRRRGAGRRAPVVRARLLRARQRVLRRLGSDQPRPRHVHGLDPPARARDRGRRRVPAEPARCGGDRMSDGYTLGRDDGDRRRAPAARQRRLLRRHRAAEQGREPRARDARARLRADLRERLHRREAACTCRSRSATASSPRRPTRSSRCPRSSPTGCRPAASTSASSAPRRSIASATSTAPSWAATTTIRRCGCPAPAARPRSRPPCRETFVMLRQTPRAFVEKLDFRTSVGYGDGPGFRERHGLPRRRRDRGRHRSRHPRARSRHVRARAHEPAPGRHRRRGSRGDRVAAAGGGRARARRAADERRADARCARSGPRSRPGAGG